MRRSRYPEGMAASKPDEPYRRNGKLAIPLPFEEAVRAALEVKPGERAPKKPRPKKTQKQR